MTALNTSLIAGENPPQPRRRKVLRVSSELLVALFQMDGSKRIKILGMPPDARIVNVSDHVHFNSGEICFMVESDEFPEIPEANYPEQLTLSVHTRDCSAVPF